MFAPRFITRTLPGLALGAGLLLAGCGESPTAPGTEREPTPVSSARIPLTPPETSVETQPAIEIPEVVPMPRVRF